MGMTFNYSILKDKEFVRGLEKYYKYDGWETRYNHFLRLILIDNIIKIKIKRKGIALDAGCSAGGHTFILERAGYDVVGIDLSKKGIERAKAWAKETKSSCQFEFGDAAALKYEDESFDLVVASEVLEHIHQNEKAAHEIYRITKHGGHIIYTMPNGRSGYWQRKKRQLKKSGTDHRIEKVVVDSKEWHILRHMEYSPKKIKQITSKGLKLKEVLSLSCGHMVPPLSILIRLMMMTGYGYRYEISKWENTEKKEEGATFVILYKKK
jgi:2-polyprenyl-3-methyl-5-hydroxy-6-metoxy-1,4-benzoquinol methylase